MSIWGLFGFRQNQIGIAVQPGELVNRQSGRPAAELPQNLQPPAGVHPAAR